MAPTGPSDSATALPAAHVLALNGLPADALITKGLLYLRPRRYSGNTWEVAYTLRPHAYLGKGRTEVFVRTGQAERFAALVRRVLAGETPVVHQGPLRQHRKEGSSGGSGRTGVKGRYPRSKASSPELQPKDAADPQNTPPPEGATEFLSRWRSRIDREEILYANTKGVGLSALAAMRLSADQRYRILALLKPWYFKHALQRLPDGDETWRIERHLPDQGMDVCAVLRMGADGQRYCLQFGQRTEALNEVPWAAVGQSPVVLRDQVSTMEVQVPWRGAVHPLCVAGHPTRTGSRFFSTRQQDQVAVQRLYNAHRAVMALPFPDEFKQFHRKHGSWYRLDQTTLSHALGWRGRRWSELQRGALPTAAETAAFRALVKDPTPIFKEMVRLNPKKYCFAPEMSDRYRYDLASTMGTRDFDHPPFLPRTAGHVTNGYRGFFNAQLQVLAAHLAYVHLPNVDQLWLAIFLCDLLEYRERGQGFTGIRYAWTENGPVAEHQAEMTTWLMTHNIICWAKGDQRPRTQRSVREHPFHYPDPYADHHRPWDLERMLPKDWHLAPVPELVQRLIPPEAVAQHRSGEWLSYDLCYAVRL